MNAKATLAAIAVKIVMVNAVVKRGEKVFNAYILSSIRFELLVMGVSARLGCSLSALLLSIVTNGGHCLIALCLHYRREKERCQVFFKCFFVGCGGVGVDAWVWVLGCGRVGVDAWVGARGSVGGGGRDGDGRARDEAGWIGIVAVGWARIASLGLPNPDSDCRLVCDR